MGIRVNFPSYFQRFTSGLDAAEVNGRTVDECLGDLVKQFPSLGKVLFCERGELDDYVGVCINREFISAWEKPLSKPVRDGDELMIILIGVGGG